MTAVSVAQEQLTIEDVARAQELLSWARSLNDQGKTLAESVYELANLTSRSVSE